MKTALAASALLLALTLTPTAASAAVNVYTITGTGSGTLGSSIFTDAAFTFTLTGDTSNLSSNIIDPLTTADVNIAGLGTVTIGIPTRLGATNTVVFFSRSDSIGGSDLFDFVIGGPVDLASAFSPVTGTQVFALNQFNNIATSGANLTFTSSSNVLFSSSLGAIAAVPEPGTWSMMLLGFGAIGAPARIRQRRRKIPLAA